MRRDDAVVVAELRHLEAQISRLDQGALDAELFKKVRLQYGVYHERRAPGEPFGAFVDRVGLPPLQEALKDLTDISRIPQDDELFVDLGATEPFRLEAGAGECAA